MKHFRHKIYSLHLVRRRLSLVYQGKKIQVLKGKSFNSQTIDNFLQLNLKKSVKCLAFLNIT